MDELIKSFEEIMSKAKNVAIFSHANLDPDAISSIMAIEFILKNKYNIPSTGFYCGAISHPQNIAMVNLLDPHIKPIDEYNKDEYDINVVVDAMPSNAGIKEGTQVHVVIDHHKDLSKRNDYNNLIINIGAGSAASTCFYIMQQMGITLSEDVDSDANLATALLIGIATDTEDLMSEDATTYEFNAWQYLFGYRIPDVMKKIINFDRPRFWVDAKASAVPDVQIIDGIAVVGMGNIPMSQRDLISDMSQELSTWADVHTSIAFAIVNGDSIEGSVRSSNASISVPNLAKELGIKGTGGGKLGKGAYKYELGGGSIDEKDTQELKERACKLFQDKEIQRIRRIIGK